MNSSNNNYSNELPQPGSKHKLLKIFLSIVMVVLAIILSVMLYFTYMAFKFKSDYTDDKQIVIEHEPITEYQREQLEKKYQELKEIVKSNKPAKIVITSKEFTQLMYYAPEAKSMADKTKFWLEGDRIKAEVSVPFDMIPKLNAIPGMKGRYLNGTFTINAKIENQNVYVKVEECVMKGRTMNKKYMDLMNSQKIQDMLMKRLTKKWNRTVESLEVVNSTMYIQIK